MEKDPRVIAMGTRLKEARIDAGFKTVRDAASALGVKYGTYSGHEAGTRGFDSELPLYARRFRVAPQWLAFGTGQKRISLVSSFDPDAPDESHPLRVIEDGVERTGKGSVRVLPPGAIAEVDLRPGAGGGGYASIVVDSNKIGQYPEGSLRNEWLLPPSFVKDELGLSYGMAEILQIHGDSMYPDLADGDRVICDRTNQKVNQGGIFAVYDGDGVIVKQVELVREAKKAQILCTSRNEKYKPFILDLDDGVFIIGRITVKIARM